MKNIAWMHPASNKSSDFTDSHEIPGNLFLWENFYSSFGVFFYYFIQVSTYLFDESFKFWHHKRRFLFNFCAYNKNGKSPVFIGFF